MATSMDFPDPPSPFVANVDRFPVGLPGYILCPYRAVVDKFFADRPTLARLCEEVHAKSLSLLVSLSLS